ncbi:unnamed protein product [Protopolystoma xenopodis]|uniref:Tryptophanyl-tRNA synthetase n=1 Tax=Protopolystoma xenopodis TaxID=117903 RepID=A0A3S4ZZG3_9PLAT|nr:unnamed protein product [Protopolystoma xenopodis]
MHIRTHQIHSLRHPEKKMSKSYGGADDAGTIWLTDDPDQLSRKVSRALTDSQPGVSYDPVGRPGLANLIRILAALEVNLIAILHCIHNLIISLITQFISRKRCRMSFHKMY